MGFVSLVVRTFHLKGKIGGIVIREGGEKPLSCSLGDKLNEMVAMSLEVVPLN